MIAALDGCYELLSPVGFPFGYRTAKEVFVYVYVWIRCRQLLGLIPPRSLPSGRRRSTRAVLQKVLPKIHRQQASSR